MFSKSIIWCHQALFSSLVIAHDLQKQVLDSILPGHCYLTSKVLQNPSSLCFFLSTLVMQPKCSTEALSAHYYFLIQSCSSFFLFFTQNVIFSTSPCRKIMIIFSVTIIHPFFKTSWWSYTTRAHSWFPQSLNSQISY